MGQIEMPDLAKSLLTGNALEIFKKRTIRSIF